MKILVTGAAGFIGFHTCLRLLQRGDRVFGIDNLNDYYTPGLKKDRLRELHKYPEFRFAQIDITDVAKVKNAFRSWRFVTVIHMAGQAGVRSSMNEPSKHIQSNIVGFANIIDQCRDRGILHFLYASSSSVYGGNLERPSVEWHNTDHPLSLYAATKKSNEVIADSYAHLFGMRITGLRYFTVYGPWGRPDMAIWKFVEGIRNDKQIDVYNHGNMMRDFTYIDDAVDCTIRLMENTPTGHRIVNVGSKNPVPLLTVVQTIEKVLGKKAIINFMDEQPGDVLATFADTTDLMLASGCVPSTKLIEGVDQFVKWYTGHIEKRST